MAESTGPCAHCGKAASLRCPRCFEGTNVHNEELTTVYYCGQECQQADFKQHKNPCRHARDRKQFYRGAVISSSLYYAFREVTFDYPLEEINVHEGKAFITYGKRVNGLLYPFPKSLVPDTALQQAVLSYNNSHEAQSYLEDFRSKLFAGIKFKDGFKVTKIKIHPIHKNVFHYNVDGSGELDQSDKDHEVTKVTLSDGNEYALDLAGAQYSQLRPGVLFQTYERAYADEWNTEPEAIGLDGDEEITPVRRSLINHLSVKTAEWEKDNKLSVAALLNERSPMFESLGVSLISKLTHEMFEHVKSLLRNGQVRIGVDQ